MLKDDHLITPSETENCLLGITRDCVFEQLKMNLILKLNQKIHRSEIYLLDEVFLTGTAAHITSVGQLDNRDIKDGNIGSLTRKCKKNILKSSRVMIKNI